ncbi:hypothetical protein [Xanthomonas sp. GPE 39]|nr:hypothetical protein [Xanthomonas sp. GPE 39]
MAEPPEDKATMVGWKWRNGFAQLSEFYHRTQDYCEKLMFQGNK